MNSLFVFDTNCFVSAALIGGTRTAQALDKAIAIGQIALSDAVLNEFIEVLFRKKFDKYFLNDEEKWYAINNVVERSVFFSPTQTITACRDPKDNKFLELAVTAQAACIVTGDSDLLILHPFENIPILNPFDFLSLSPDHP
jgi:putative PIN family toxin of toxin-antitoxin system